LQNPQSSFTADRDAYRLRKETLAVVRDHNTEKKGFAFIPSGATVYLLGKFSGDARMTEVEWDGRVVLVFTEVFLERAVPL